MDNFYSHKTAWPGFTETLYISHDEKVSFSIYRYDKDAGRLVLHNLYVTPCARGAGRASAVLKELQSCIGRKTLGIYITNRKLIKWYTARGFVRQPSGSGIIYMTYTK